MRKRSVPKKQFPAIEKQLKQNIQVQNKLLLLHQRCFLKRSSAAPYKAQPARFANLSKEIKICACGDSCLFDSGRDLLIFQLLGTSFHEVYLLE